MSFYDIHYGNGLGIPPLQGTPTTSLPAGTMSPQVGYTDRTDPEQLAATARAVQVARALPSNQPTNEQGRNWVQGLANSFDPLRAEGSDALDPEHLLKNRNWNMLYSVAPDKANQIYKQISGKTFDAVLKEREDQKKFILRTVQDHIANGRIRQDEMGNWLEMKDAPDDSLGALPGATKKKEVPASLQTLDLINKVGGAEGLGLKSFKTNDPVQLAKQLRAAGWTDAGIRDYFRKNAVATVTAKPQAQPVEAAPYQGRYIPRAIEALYDLPNRLPFMRTPTTFENRQAADADEIDKFGGAQGMVGALTHNLLSRLFTGAPLQEVNPDISTPPASQQELDRLRSILQRR